MQETQDTIDRLQTKVVDLEVQLRQSRASHSDFQESSTAEIRRLQTLLDKSHHKAASHAASGSQLTSFVSEMAQLSSELGTKLTQAVAPLTGSPHNGKPRQGKLAIADPAAGPEDAVAQLRSVLGSRLQETADLVTAHTASSADAVAQLQKQLQQAESAASQAESESAVHARDLAQLRLEFQESQNSVTRLEDMISQAEQEHAASLQVRRCLLMGATEQASCVGCFNDR